MRPKNERGKKEKANEIDKQSNLYNGTTIKFGFRNLVFTSQLNPHTTQVEFCLFDLCELTK